MLVLAHGSRTVHHVPMTLKEAQALLKEKQAKITQLEKELAKARQNQPFRGTKVRIIASCEIISGPDSDGDYDVLVGGLENEVYLNRDEFEVIT